MYIVLKVTLQPKTLTYIIIQIYHVVDNNINVKYKFVFNTRLPFYKTIVFPGNMISASFECML